MFGTQNYEKDKIIFVTKEDQDNLGTPVVDGPDGAILPNGEINWDCPCLGGMANGVCGTAFRKSFQCFAESTTEPKGIDCVEAFITFQNCIKDHPDQFPDKNNGLEEEPAATEQL